MMRSDFAVLILTHGRANNVKTLSALQKSNYTGKWYMVIDDEDDQEPLYREAYGDDHVVKFCKNDVCKWTDAGDNTGDHKAILWARNVSFEIARNLGLKYFMMNDDDFDGYFNWTTNKARDIRHPNRILCLDDCLEAAISFLEASNSISVAFAQGGDFIGGFTNPSTKNILRRKCMNTFICKTDRQFQYYGRMNEDVSTYVLNGMRGNLMFTICPIYVGQLQTQSLAGGMSETYKNEGTYTKSFYSIMYAPSAVKLTMIAGHTQSNNGKASHWRIHHNVTWDKCSVKIIRENYKKQ